ncbi:MAG: hypothetical protein AAGN46_13110, partial [Acidobacteriota bacterium]
MIAETLNAVKTEGLAALRLAAAALLVVAAVGCAQDTATTSETTEPAPAETATTEPSAEQSSASSDTGGVQVDAGLNDYTPVQGVSGTIKSVGSDTLNNLMT